MRSSCARCASWRSLPQNKKDVSNDRRNCLSRARGCSRLPRSQRTPFWQPALAAGGDVGFGYVRRFGHWHGRLAVIRRLPRAIGLPTLLLTLAAAPSKAQELLAPSVRHSYDVGTGDRELIGIRDLYFTPSGDLVVLDRDMVLVFDAGGNERYAWGGMGDGPGEFKAPLSVAANDSTVLVGEAGRIGMYSLAGEHVRVYRTGGLTSFVAIWGLLAVCPWP